VSSSGERHIVRARSRISVSGRLPTATLIEGRISSREIPAASALPARVRLPRRRRRASARRGSPPSMCTARPRGRRALACPTSDSLPQGDARKHRLGLLAAWVLQFRSIEVRQPHLDPFARIRSHCDTGLRLRFDRGAPPSAQTCRGVTQPVGSFGSDRIGPGPDAGGGFPSRDPPGVSFCYPASRLGGRRRQGDGDCQPIEADAHDQGVFPEEGGRREQGGAVGSIQSRD
jgi:hypothetical protein